MSTVNAILQVIGQLHGLRVLFSVAFVIVIWRLRANGSGRAFLEALNDVHINVWAVTFIGWGVLLAIHGKDNISQVLITSGFAILRGPTPKPLNGGTNNAPTTITVPTPDKSAANGMSPTPTASGHSEHL